jgi:hypothetical protein
VRGILRCAQDDTVGLMRHSLYVTLFLSPFDQGLAGQTLLDKHCRGKTCLSSDELMVQSVGINAHNSHPNEIKNHGTWFLMKSHSSQDCFLACLRGFWALKVITPSFASSSPRDWHSFFELFSFLDVLHPVPARWPPALAGKGVPLPRTSPDLRRG